MNWRHLSFSSVLFIGTVIQLPSMQAGDTKTTDLKPLPPPFPTSEPEEIVSTPAKKIATRITENSLDTSKFYDVILVAPADATRPGDARIGIGYFNHTDRDILLEIDGRSVKLAPRHHMQVRMPREFSWREQGGKWQKAKVPPEADGMEIVFRQKT